MDKISKALNKLTPKEKKVVSFILTKLIKGDFSNFNLKKLKGHNDVFRVRKGKLRILFQLGKGDIKVISVDRRKEDTYKL